jgi:hypothetical protein
MTAIVLPDIDRSTIEELKKRIPDLSEIELSLPSRKEVNRAAKEVSKTADDTIDRLLGRKRAPVWPWVAAGVGLVAIAGIVAAWFAWFRRPSWQTQSEPWSGDAYDAEQSTVQAPGDAGFAGTQDAALGGAAGTISSEAKVSSIGSAPYPIEEA